MIACAVLAAGASRRLGRPKQLVPVGGAPLVRRAVDAALASKCHRVAVVVGARADEVTRAIDDRPIAIVANDAWPEGIAASIRAAVTWAAGAGARALLLTTCDQPRLDAAHLDALLAEHARGADRVASAYAGARGVPAIFASTWFDRLGALSGDRGAGPLLRDAPFVAWEDGAVDVDTPADLDGLVSMASGTSERA